LSGGWIPVDAEGTLYPTRDGEIACPGALKEQDDFLARLETRRAVHEGLQVANPPAG